MFDSLKLTAPESEQEIEQKIAELKDREALFMRACNEEVKEEDQTMIDKIKGENKRNKKKEEKKIEEDDFPALWCINHIISIWYRCQPEFIRVWI